MSRTYIDPQQSSTTELTVDRFALGPIPAGSLTLDELVKTTWISTEL
jgi:hypothetical protein